MSDAWEEIQAIKNKRNSLREKLEKRKKERQDILGTTLLQATVLNAATAAAPTQCDATTAGNTMLIAASSPNDHHLHHEDAFKSEHSAESNSPSDAHPVRVNPEFERDMLRVLNESTLQMPLTAHQLLTKLDRQVSLKAVCNVLQKFATQQLITIKDLCLAKDDDVEITYVEHGKLVAMLVAENISPACVQGSVEDHMSGKRKRDTSPENKKDDARDILSLLTMPSTKEKENKKLGEEILDLLSKPTAKEKSLAERFRSQGGAQVKEFCPHGTKAECQRNENVGALCKKLHFRKIIQKHTDEALGDCSFLNTCFHMDTCKYVHYEVDRSGHLSITATTANDSTVAASAVAVVAAAAVMLGGTQRASAAAATEGSTLLYPPQWVQCDLRYLDMTALGKFAVIMADPPWDIHMELPYGTMSDDEMRQLGIPQLQDDGLIFLWVTGRAMELGRECLNLWGYERVDEIIWVKTNQLQRIIRTGRTGHWLNHGKEHCLVGMKGNPKNLNRGLDCDVIVAEVRATSHKPDEIYGMIERLSPGTRKIELFGRPHNIQPNWITLGNQVDGIRLIDPELIESFKRRYPDGNCMTPVTKASH